MLISGVRIESAARNRPFMILGPQVTPQRSDGSWRPVAISVTWFTRTENNCAPSVAACEGASRALGPRPIKTRLVDLALG
jgi:hypothetical protein